MTAIELEKRLAAVERELARLKSDHANNTGSALAPRHPVEALEQIHGTFENDEAFQEATRLGRKWRRAQRGSSRKRASGK